MGGRAVLPGAIALGCVLAFGPSAAGQALRYPLPNPYATPATNQVASAAPREALPRVRPLLLRETLEMALRNSGIVRVLSGGGVQAEDVTRFDVETAIARARVETARFDPRLTAGAVRRWLEEPTGDFLAGGVPETERRYEGGLIAALSKPLRTGGEAVVAYNPPLGYREYPGAAFASSFNPLFTSNLEVGLRQPLLRGAGLDVNAAPIVVAQLRADQSQLEFQQELLALVRSTVEAYWELQSVLQVQSALRQAVELSAELVRVEEERYRLEQNIRGDVARVRVQFHAFQVDVARLQASMRVRELRLRNLLGLPPVDAGSDAVESLLPVDHPLVARVAFDAEAVTREALVNRPDLLRQRKLIDARTWELRVAENALWPQLDARGLYRRWGVGDQFGDSLSWMNRGNFADWDVGATFSLSLGRRADKARFDAVRLQLARERAELQQLEHSAKHRLAELLAEIDAAYVELIESQRRAQEAALWLDGARIRYLTPPPAAGGDGVSWLLDGMLDYLAAMRGNLDAVRSTADAIAEYNTLIARLHEEQGRMLHEYGVFFPCNGELPVVGGSLPPQLVAGAPSVLPALFEPLVLPPPRPWKPPPPRPKPPALEPLPEPTLRPRMQRLPALDSGERLPPVDG